MKKLDKILTQHRLWLESGGKEGMRASLKGAWLEGADLSEAYISGACLKGATLSGAALWRSNFEGADLRGADLRRATVYKAVFTGAKLPEDFDTKRAK